MKIIMKIFSIKKQIRLCIVLKIFYLFKLEVFKMDYSYSFRYMVFIIGR